MFNSLENKEIYGAENNNFEAILPLVCLWRMPSYTGILFHLFRQGYLEPNLISKDVSQVVRF